MTTKNAKITGQLLYGLALLVLFIVLLVFSGVKSPHAATASGTAPNETIAFETLASNTTTGFATLDEAYDNAIYEFSLTGTADKEVHVKHRIGNTSRFTNATTNVIQLNTGEFWNHRVVLNNTGVQAAKIQCVSGCGTGETITTKGIYIK